MVAVHEDVLDFEMEDMRDYLGEDVVEGVKDVVKGTLSRTLPETVPAMVDRFLPGMLKESTDWTLTNTLTRGITHATAPPVALAMARPTEEEFICSSCYHQQQHCDECSWSISKKGELLEHVDFLNDYYSDQFGDHFTGVADAVGFPQGSSQQHAPSFFQVHETVLPKK